MLPLGTVYGLTTKACAAQAMPAAIASVSTVSTIARQGDGSRFRSLPIRAGYRRAGRRAVALLGFRLVAGARGSGPQPLGRWVVACGGCWDGRDRGLRRARPS